jgi:Ca2+-binding EF-hand superfamily protein
MVFYFSFITRYSSPFLPPSSYLLSGAILRRRKGAKGGKKNDDLAILKMFDIDGDGTIEIHEVLSTCSKLGIIISQAELKIVWPMFHPNPRTGAVQLNDFAAAFKNAKLAKLNPDASMGLHTNLLEIGKAQRKIRINQKTQQFEKLGQVTTMLRQYLTKVLKDRSMTPKELFDVVDLDGGNSIAPSEFRAFLRVDGLELSEVQLQVIWPLLCADKTGEMGPKEFTAFIKNASGWSPGLMFDRFTHQMEVASAYKTLLGAFEQTWVCETPTPQIRKPTARRRRLSVTGGIDQKAAAIKHGMLQTPTDNLLRRVSVAYNRKMSRTGAVRAMLPSGSTPTALPLPGIESPQQPGPARTARRRRVSLFGVLGQERNAEEEPIEQHDQGTSDAGGGGLDEQGASAADGWSSLFGGDRENLESDDEWDEATRFGGAGGTSRSLINSALQFCTLDDGLHLQLRADTRSPSGRRSPKTSAAAAAQEQEQLRTSITQEQLRTTAEWRETTMIHHRERMDKLKKQAPTLRMGRKGRGTASPQRLKGFGSQHTPMLSPSQKQIIANCAKLRRGFVRVKTSAADTESQLEQKHAIAADFGRATHEAKRIPRPQPQPLTTAILEGAATSGGRRPEKGMQQGGIVLTLATSPVKASLSVPNSGKLT